MLETVLALHCFLVIIFHCIDIKSLVDALISSWEFGLFPLLAAVDRAAININLCWTTCFS